MAVYKYLDCSTAHITQRDNALLANIAGNPDSHGLRVMDYGEGFIFFVPGKDFLEDYIKEARDEGLSKYFTALIKHASKKGCYKLVIDCDGDDLRGFKKHNW